MRLSGSRSRGRTETGPPTSNVFALEERSDARMFFVFGAVDVACFAQLIVLENVLDLDDAAQRRLRPS